MSNAGPPAGHSSERPAAVYLLRHAQTGWSALGRHTSRTDVPLTADGERRAGGLGSLLDRIRGGGTEPPVVLCSPRRRATRTAELAGLGPVTVVDDLAEWDYGDYEGLTTPQIRETVPGWTVWTHPTPGGETADEVAARADRVLARVAQLAQVPGLAGPTRLARPTELAGPTGLAGPTELVGPTDVVLVGHGHFSRVLAARWIGLPATAGVHFALDPGGVTVLGNERGVPRLDHVNLS